jgi:hypothetical protein
MPTLVLNPKSIEIADLPSIAHGSDFLRIGFFVFKESL